MTVKDGQGWSSNGYAKVVNGQKRLGTNEQKNGNGTVKLLYHQISIDSIDNDFPHFFRPIHIYTHLIILP